MSAWPFVCVVLSFAAMLWLIRRHFSRISREQLRKYSEACGRRR